MKFKILLLISFLIILPHLIKGQEKEYLLKAGFLEKFARFTQWPDITANYFEIAVIGDSPFKKSFNEFYQTAQIKELPVKIRYIKSVSEIKNCNLLFICESEQNKLTDILLYTSNKPILTISDTDKFAERGVLINFYETNQGTIHFEINTLKMKQSRVKIDALLLSYAKIIN